MDTLGHQPIDPHPATKSELRTPLEIRSTFDRFATPPVKYQKDSFYPPKQIYFYILCMTEGNRPAVSTLHVVSAFAVCTEGIV